MTVVGKKDMSKSENSGMNYMVRLTYISRASEGVNSEALVAILKSARENNSINGITGMLVFNTEYFLQSIEGSRVEVNALLNQIFTDERHFDLQIIEAKEIEERFWSDWSMDYATPTEKNRNEFLRFSPNAKFNPYQMKASAINKMLLRLSQKGS